MPTHFVAVAPPIEGFQYEPGFISHDEERQLLSEITKLSFSSVVFRGVEARRRVAQFGWDYEFGSRNATPGDPMPPFLLPLRERAGALAGIRPGRLEEVLITEYQPGAGIGWHRDALTFGDIVGVSLVSSAKLRFKPLGADRGEQVTIELEPRSAYVICGEARQSWQHSIAPIKALRYSITFRTIRDR